MCWHEKPADQFVGKRGKATKCCLECLSIQAARNALQDPQYQRDYYKKNRTRLIAKAREKATGCTPEQYDQLMVEQGGVCAICGQVCRRALAADHDHETGRVRGLLCADHNTALGLFQDNPDFLRAAADYIEKSTFKLSV